MECVNVTGRQLTAESLPHFNVCVLCPADIPLLKEAWSLPACYQHHSPILSPPLARTDYVHLLTSVTPPSRAQQRKDSHPFLNSVFCSVTCAEQNQWRATGHPSNWRKLVNLILRVKSTYWVLIVYYRLRLNIKLPSRCSLYLCGFILAPELKQLWLGACSIGQNM